MEQKRSFIIILTVTLVLASFFGAATWLFYPYQQTDRVLSAGDISRFFQGTSLSETIPEALSGDLAESLPDAKQPEDPALVSGDVEIVFGILSDAYHIDDPLGRRLPMTHSVSEAQGVMTTSTSTVHVENRSQHVLAAPAAQSVPSRTQPGVQTPPAGSAGTPESARPSSPTPTAAPKTQPPAQATPARVSAPHTPTVQEYWIQVISSPSRDRVEQVQEEFYAYGLGGRVTTTMVNNTTYFRLRYGPYTQRAEAQKFLDWLKDIPQFSESFISVEFRAN